MRTQSHLSLSVFALLGLVACGPADDDVSTASGSVACDKHPSHWKCLPVPTGGSGGTGSSGGSTAGGGTSGSGATGATGGTSGSGATGATGGTSGSGATGGTAGSGGTSGSGATGATGGSGGTAGTTSCPTNIGASSTEPSYAAQVYVDGKNGVDTNPGTLASPVKTIQQGIKLANANNQKNIGTKLVIQAGTYRETFALAYGGTATLAPLAITAAQNGSVIVTGADSWTGGWTAASTTGVYTRAWPYKWGPCAIPSGWDPTMLRNIVRRRELVFVDGQRMTQVLSASQLKPGTFHVDEAAAKISLRPPVGKDPNLVPVEVGVRSRLGEIGGTTNVTLRGLVIQHAANCFAQDNAVHLHSNKNFRVEDLLVRQNNGVGIAHAYGDGITFRNLVSTQNGGNAGGGFKVKNALWDNVELSHTGHRTAQGAFYGWDTAGAKWAANHGATLKNVRGHFNLSRGFWHDYDNTNICIEGMVSSGNLRGGYWSEANQGPIAMKNSVLCRNNARKEPLSAGFEISNSHDVSVENTTLFDNQVGQMFIGGGDANGRAVSDWETGQTYTLFWDNFEFLDNSVVALGTQRVVRLLTGSTAFSKFTATLGSDYNQWWNPNDPKPFEVMANQMYDLAGWRTKTGADAASTFSDPAPSCQLPATAPDYWLIVDAASKNPAVVTAGATTSFVFRTIPLGGFSSNVSLSFDGLSQIGASGSLSASSVSASGSSTLTVTTSATTPKALHEITMIANSGNLTRTVVVALQVQ